MEHRRAFDLGFELEAKTYCRIANVLWRRTEPEPFCTVGTFEDLLQRLSFIVAALKEEPWLPLPARIAVLECALQLGGIEDAAGADLRQASAFVAEMAAACFRFDDLTLGSVVLRQVRVLDMELAARIRDTSAALAN